MTHARARDYRDETAADAWCTACHRPAVIVTTRTTGEPVEAYHPHGTMTDFPCPVLIPVGCPCICYSNRIPTGYARPTEVTRAMVESIFGPILDYQWDYMLALTNSPTVLDRARAATIRDLTDRRRTR